jgi:hypothetical protein
MRQTRAMTDPEQPTSWSVPPMLVGTAWVLAVAALLYAVFTSDPIGRLVLGVATVAFGAFAAFGSIARPRLAVHADGIEVRRLSGRQRLAWGAVRISVSATRRLGRTVSLLELDTENEEDPDGGLIVLGWLDLGTEPQQVAAVLRRHQLR